MDLREKIAEACIQPLGHISVKSLADAERVWVGHQLDSVETGSLAYMCREIADAILQIPEIKEALVAKEQLDAAREDWTVGDVRSDIYEQMRDIRPLG